MSYARQVNRMLDDEHRAILELLARVERAFAASRGAPDAALGSLSAAFARRVEEDIARHFEFEERELFPRMADAGDGDMAGLLRDEHAAIRAVAAELVPLAQAGAAGTLDDDGWRDLARVALEMAERQTAHINKETAALLPLVEDLLDDDTDRELAFAYAATA